MCKTCAGIGKVMDFDINKLIDVEKTYDEGCFMLPSFGTGKYYWRMYRHPEYFRTDIPWKDLSEKEQNLLLYGSFTPDGGTKGGTIVFTGTPKDMIDNGATITAKYLRKS